MARKKIRIYENKLDIYDQYFYVVFDQDSLNYHLNRMGFENCDVDGDMGFVYHKDGNLVIYVNVKDYDEAEIISTIAHESFHLVDFLFKKKGLLFDNEEVTNEHVAYPLGYVSKCVYKNLIEYRKCKK